MHKDIEKILFSEEQLSETVRSVAKQINDDYAGKQLVLVCILKGSIMFFSDLVRNIDCDCELEFLSASSYGSSTVSSGKVKLGEPVKSDISGKHVLIVEDILDTGRTLSYRKAHMESLSPKSVRICALFDKPARRCCDISADYKGVTIEDNFIVGYGLDYNEKFRNLPYVGILKQEIYSKK